MLSACTQVVQTKVNDWACKGTLRQYHHLLTHSPSPVAEHEPAKSMTAERFSLSPEGRARMRFPREDISRIEPPDPPLQMRRPSILPLPGGEGRGEGNFSPPGFVGRGNSGTVKTHPVQSKRMIEDW